MRSVWGFLRVVGPRVVVCLCFVFRLSLSLLVFGATFIVCVVCGYYFLCVLLLLLLFVCVGVCCVGVCLVCLAVFLCFVCLLVLFVS